MSLSLPTGVALTVLLDVAHAGALTAAAVTCRHGPCPNWDALITDGLLTSLATVRGAVLVLSPTGHALLQAHGLGPHDRVSGVERAVDRSYQQDALALLQGQGYRVTYPHRQGGPLGHARVVRYTVEVPPAQLAQLEHDWPSQPPPFPGQPFHEALGRPSVYATCSRGGRGRKAVQDLAERVHHRHIDDVWRSPLIVFVPDMTPDLRNYLRRHAAQRNAKLDRQFGPGQLHGGRPRYADLDVRVLPL
ncbi:hypothetical protein [Deinococcus humi]|uniref:Uncharacterized protein n=1 Tax=Deinococcus humi TaxID=662880 RepID=A0A7W8JX59_9DEIO|nr:hypothetical protein [Deinococcus humi]MBB5364850.1 hypothetical protein [Deinococcus humi]GGO33899.1 hypothetical protein GCM10008949_33850 [Deinococcus humi]